MCDVIQGPATATTALNKQSRLATLVYPLWSAHRPDGTRLFHRRAPYVLPWSCHALLLLVTVCPLRLGGTLSMPMAEEQPAEQHELDALRETRPTMEPDAHDEQLHRRTLRKLDLVLLPFLALLFLFNSLDKSNVR